MNSRPQSPRSSEITPPEVYFNRRAFLKTGAIAATAAATGLIYRRLNRLPAATAEEPALAGFEPAGAGSTPTTQASATQPSEALSPEVVKAFKVDEPQTPYQSVTHYNNYYEFSTDKDGVANEIGGFSSAGWKVKIDGLVGKPGVFDLDDIHKISRPEERVYRMRCVEAWSMVVPWAGYSLSKLLQRVEPRSGAKYVAFTTLLDPKMMPGQNTSVLEWPYVEGLRMDEAMHPLTLLTMGLYGRQLPVQDGAPLRLIIPWKYGFKGIKAIVKITLTDTMPPTTWNISAPGEYGFYANVNPDVPHPRWSQATEERIGQGRRPTLMFNGYGEQVASLYTGMDLAKFY
jgi:sulfoxide reductase catalytic subunit YedY